MDALTPEEFAAKMLEIFGGDPTKGIYDEEGAHLRADELMCGLLRQLGYGAGVNTFQSASKWYA
jgi:hypothetical protein